MEALWLGSTLGTKKMSQEQFYQTVQLQEEYEMNTQSKALRLADLLQDELGVDGYVHDEAAAELRRLHAANQVQSMDIGHMYALNAELLEALKGLLADITEYQTINHLGGENNHWQVIARAAIAKAEAQQ